MIVITKRPYTYCFSKNRIGWQFYISNPLADGCGVQVKITVNTADDLGEETLVYQTPTIKANSFGYADVFLEDIIDSMIPYDYPDKTDIVTRATNIRTVFVQYRKVTDLTPNPAWINDAGNTITVIKGGVENLKFDYNNYFKNSLVGRIIIVQPKNNWLTWQPSGSRVAYDDDFYMSCLLHYLRLKAISILQPNTFLLKTILTLPIVILRQLFLQIIFQRLLQ